MDGPIPLDERKQQILKAVVSDYTETGIPVGSHALATHLASWSSATIRNDLASLVDIGYLLQPHTSAGRVPSERGYRYYVDFLMEEESLPAAVRRELDLPFASEPAALEQVLELAAQVLARVTEAVSIITAPQALGATVKHLDLVSLDDRHALVMLVLEGNLIRQQPVLLSDAADQAELSALAGTLNLDLRGHDAEGIAGLPARAPGEGATAAAADRLCTEVVAHIVRIMRGVDSRQDAMVVHDGVRNLLRQPEFGDVERLQQVLEVMEEQRMLGEVLASLEANTGVTVMIGTENRVAQLRECSLVLTTYRAGNARFGTIGVLGPTRMRYPHVAPRVRYVSQRTGQALDRLFS